MNDGPLAYFITWTVYGTFLQGDARGWRKWKHGFQPARPQLLAWRAGQLLHPVKLLTAEQRHSLEGEIRRLSEYRGWKLWANSVRSNHVHVAVHADGLTGSKVRDQLKANCTRKLREEWAEFCQRPVWTVAGDWRCINTEDDLEQVVTYINEAQDRKDRDLPPGDRG